MKQEHEMTPGVLVSGDDMSAGDYKARCAVLEAELAELRGRVDQEAKVFWVLFDNTGGEKYIKKDADAGTLAFFDNEEDAARAKRFNLGTDYMRIEYYTTPQTAPTACTGKNCGSTDPNLHSADCFAEHDQAIAPTAAPDVAGQVGALEDIAGTHPRSGEQDAYPDCDTCGKAMDYMPWHYSKGDERHLHACDECWPKVDPSAGAVPESIASDDDAVSIRAQAAPQPAKQQSAVTQLVEALEECAASLAWNCFGECRAIHAGPIMPAVMALDTARAALAAYRKQQEGEA